jgi:hypothetical protein
VKWCATRGCKRFAEQDFRHCGECIAIAMEPTLSAASIKKRAAMLELGLWATENNKCGICKKRDALPDRRVCDVCLTARTKPKVTTPRALYRNRMREQKLCINGEAHGKATHGCRCKRCYFVHRGKGEADDVSM